MYNYEHKSSSVKNLIALLNRIIQTPTSYKATEVYAALESQGSLAKYSSKELEIYATSLNTLKSHAQLFIPGGFTYLNSLRQTAHDAVNRINSKESSVQNRNKVQIASALNDQKQTNILIMQDLALMTLLLEKALRMASLYARMEPNGTTFSICSKETSEIYKSLSFRRIPHGD